MKAELKKVLGFVLSVTFRFKIMSKLLKTSFCFSKKEKKCNN